MLLPSCMLFAFYILLSFANVAVMKIAPVQATPTGPIAVHASSINWDSMLTNPEGSTASGGSAQTTASTLRGNSRVG